MQQELSIRQKRVMTYFIEATEKLIGEDGIDSLSRRKIATEAGYNSATLYNFFQDLEHLVLFASVRYLREYVEELQDAVKPEMNSLETYRLIYEKFTQTCLRFPELFYNMFFGHYSAKLDEVLKQYYEIFPDELSQHTGFIRRMLSQGNIYERDLAYMDALVADGFVTEEKKKATVQILVRTHQSFIYEAWMKGDALDARQHLRNFMELFDYILSSAK